jgi:hypothetical protein
MAAMLSRVVTEHPTLQIIELAFLELGHTHLECNSDHTRIGRVKKSTTVEIRVPQNWYLFVQSVRGTTPLKV